METKRQRNRPPVSCVLCRQRKIRCNRELPCSSCLRSRGGTCTYENSPAPKKRHSRLILSQASIESPSSIASHETQSTLNDSNHTDFASHPHSASPNLVSAQDKRTPSEGIGKATGRSTTADTSISQSNSNLTSVPNDTQNPRLETTTSRIAGTFHTWRIDRREGQAPVIYRGTMHKHRLFGLSHYTSGVTLFQDIIQTIEPHIQGEASKTVSGIKRCKQLARLIKSQRQPTWPSLPTNELPPKAITDELVDKYLQTMESLYRVLHIPSFRKEYEALWTCPSETDMSFIIQVKLMLAIGAATYDEKFSLRTSAVKWVSEAHMWLSQPNFKAQLSIRAIQNNILLIIAREAARIGHGVIWTSIGSLLRTAVYVGLHRDPARLQKRTVLSAELRRRLWNTILELSLQSSMTSGGPPLLSMEDFDTEPPLNFDDEQLMNEDPSPKPQTQFTDSSVATALRATFPQRLAVVKFLNNLGSEPVYEEVLRLDKSLREAYKVLRSKLSQGRKDAERTPSTFQVRVLDFIMHRYLSAIHIPFFNAALYEARYAFSRKVVAETVYKLWCAVSPPRLPGITDSFENTTKRQTDSLARLALCGSGFFRTVAMQAAVILAAELRAQLHEEDSLEPAPLRTDLVTVINDAKSWSLRCMENGETNVKGYLGMSMIFAHIDALRQNRSRDEIPPLLVQAAESAVEESLSILEKQVINGGGEEAAKDLDDASFASLPVLGSSDWDFLISEPGFDFGFIEPVDFMQDD